MSITIIYLENLLQKVVFTNFEGGATAEKVGEAVNKYLDVDFEDQVLLRVDEAGQRLVELEPGEIADSTLLLLNKSIATESEAKELMIMTKPLEADSELAGFTREIDVSQDKARNPHLHQTANLSAIVQHDIAANFNFKPIVANQAAVQSKLEAVDVIQLQTYEQLFFNNFAKIKALFRKYKAVSKAAAAELAHLETASNSAALLNSWLSRGHSPQGASVVPGLGSPAQELQMQYQNLKRQTQEILLMYREGIESLKHHKLHPKLQNDAQKCLMDIYYKEEQMNSFRDSLKRQYDKLRLKVDAHLAKVGAGSDARSSNVLFDEAQLKHLRTLLQEEFEDGKEPLIVSVVHSVHQTLQQMHTHLATLADVEAASQSSVKAA